MTEDEKCECGLVEGGKLLVCPMHYRRLIEDSNLNYLFEAMHPKQEPDKIEDDILTYDKLMNVKREIREIVPNAFHDTLIPMSEEHWRKHFPEWFTQEDT